PRARAPVTVEQTAALPEIAAERARRHRCLLPASPGLRAVREARGGAESCLAHLPQLLFLPRVVEKLVGGPARDARHQGARLRIGFLLGVAAELHQPP